MKRRLNRQASSQRGRLSVPRPAATPQTATPSTSTARSKRGSWLGLLVAIPLGTCLIAFLVWNQVQIARVMFFGTSTQATIVTIRPCSRATSGDLTLTFISADGRLHTATHSSYDLIGCVDNRYHVGDSIPIRYVTNDPGVLMTQAEIDYLPGSVIIFSLSDFIFLGGPVAIFVFLFVPWASSRLLPWLRARSAARRQQVPLR
jgi:hypothetical protein